MMSSVIPARLEFQCGHAVLVTLPRVKGETSPQRNERVAREKSAALTRQCDFCGPTVEVVVAAPPPEIEATVAAPVEAIAVQVNGTHLTVEEAVAAEPVVTAEPEAELVREPARLASIEAARPEPVVRRPRVNGVVRVKRAS